MSESPTTQSVQMQQSAAAVTSVPSGLWRTLSTRTRSEEFPKGLDAAYIWLVSQGVPHVPRSRRFWKMAGQVLALEADFTDIADAKLKDQALEMRDLIRLNRHKHEDTIRAAAIVREVAWRQMGMKPYPVQVMAGLAMFHGCIVEMATGEGKTLSATMPATMLGWRGLGCHVITVNDYLAARDAQLMAPIYNFCGLQVASVVGETPPPERRAAYLADVTYSTNKEVAADVLRDRLAMGRNTSLPSVLLGRIQEPGQIAGTDRLVLRGLEHAIVDEADSVLIDEAVTPLIISGEAPNAEQTQAFEQAAAFCKQLELSTDYRVNVRFHEITLTNRGKDKLAKICADQGGIWSGARRREELVVQALTAHQLYELGKQYVIQEEKIVIVDESTGRLMPDRTWRDGLHQAVEAKERLEVQPPKDTMARISFQRFFRMYKHLGGMTGTAEESQSELWQVYRRPVAKIPTHRPCIRTLAKDRIFVKAADKWQAIVDHIDEVHKRGQPILVGTRSVQASELLSEMLTHRGLEHVVLNAVRHKEEAAIVAEAGQPRRITVATNMAGRGTDIKLGRGVADLGGLHVIATERHESGRVDRQLFGRAGRQGDPGSACAFVSLEDELLMRHAPGWAKKILARMSVGRREIGSPMARKIVDIAQKRAQRIASRQRQGVLRNDDWLDEFLGFAGSEK